MRTLYPCRLYKVLNLKFYEDSPDGKTPGEGRRTQRPGHCDNDNKDSDNSPHVSILLACMGVLTSWYAFQ